MSELPHEKYKREFETDKDESKLLKKAFLQAADIRKFEIDLYWKRAGYFWALIAFAFAGYFAVLSSDHTENKFFLSSIVASIGIVFTVAWYLANRGSKYWQENWENHLELLENKITGPLYKTRLERAKENPSVAERLTFWAVVKKLTLWVTDPLDVSVSKLNQWVSVFVFFIWIVVMVYSVYKSWGCGQGNAWHNWLVRGSHGILVSVVLVICSLMCKLGRTDKGRHFSLTMKRRTSQIDKSE